MTQKLDPKSAGIEIRREIARTLHGIATTYESAAKHLETDEKAFALYGSGEVSVKEVVEHLATCVESAKRRALGRTEASS